MYTNRHRIKNEDVRDKVKVISIKDKMQKSSSRWFSRVIGDMDAPLRGFEKLAVDEFMKGRDRSKKYWKEVIKLDMT